MRDPFGIPMENRGEIMRTLRPWVELVKHTAHEFDITFAEALGVWESMWRVSHAAQEEQRAEAVREFLIMVMDQEEEDGGEEPWKG